MVTTSWVLCNVRFHSGSRRGSGGWLRARLVCRLAKARALSGWVQNDTQGVEISVEGSEASREKFLRELKSHPPEAAPPAAIDIRRATPPGLRDFVIRASPRGELCTPRVSPDPSVRLSRRNVRSREPPLRLSVYPGHQLWSPLYCDPGPCLREQSNVV